MIYKKPETVKSPKNKITQVDVIYNGEGLKVKDPGFSIAIVTWDGVRRLAMRWNISENEWYDHAKTSGLKECVGNPQSRGHATWFIIPPQIFNPEDPITSEVITKLGNLDMFNK